jgi:hypothetical protein
MYIWGEGVQNVGNYTEYGIHIWEKYTETGVHIGGHINRIGNTYQRTYLNRIGDIYRR